jgi:hypothetical protein
MKANEEEDACQGIEEEDTCHMRIRSLFDESK